MSAPVQPVTPAPVQSAPAVPTPVQSTPVQSAPVAPTPVTPVQSVTPTPVNVPVQPVTPTPVQPTVTPAAPVAPTQPVAPAEVTPNAPVQEEVPVESTANGEENVTVVSTKKSRVSNIILIIIIGILIAFVFNMDTIIEYYELYMETGSLTKPDDTPTDNLANGYILIDDNSSSIKVDNIRFYNFRKTGDTTLSFHYNALAKYETPATLGIYIEVYNYEKELLYKELFDTQKMIEKDTVRTYSITLDANVYADARFALVKQYTDEEKNATSTLVCKTEENNLKRSITYNFKNNGLSSYDVSITKVSEDASLDSEYESVKDKFNATLENDELKYTVDLGTEIEGYRPLYVKDTTKVIIKNKEELKKWTCE